MHPAALPGGALQLCGAHARSKFAIFDDGTLSQRIPFFKALVFQIAANYPVFIRYE